MPFYSVEDNYTTNPRRERLNSLYCLGELEPISRNSSYKREWERLIPEYPFCFASGVPTSHSLLKYSLNEEKKQALCSRGGCREVLRDPVVLGSPAAAKQPPLLHGGCSISPTPKLSHSGDWRQCTSLCPQTSLFPPRKPGVCKTEPYDCERVLQEWWPRTHPFPVKRGSCASVTCSRLSRWRG